MQDWRKHIPNEYLPSYVAEARPGVYTSLVLCLLLVAFCFLLWEWLSIGVLAMPEKIAEYHFGSEAMVGEGGPTYKSATTYAQSALSGALFPVLPLIILFALATVKNNAFSRALAWVSLLAAMLHGWLTT